MLFLIIGWGWFNKIFFWMEWKASINKPSGICQIIPTHYYNDIQNLSTVSQRTISSPKLLAHYALLGLWCVSDNTEI